MMKLFRENIEGWIAWHLPKRIVLHVIVRAFVKATHDYPTKDVDRIGYTELYNSWAKDEKKT